ncbi:hypothetical protein CLG96_03345 [Sphingomonas oleivorans]|uniref:Uncharacterized protein n=1 Tax=Sphingomonas oleivorans TaxID=1735121 RepID=A0A2T5G216_9SPHN|nr:hypothetical protein [Sphingomonas oleivorans]PTQ13176.1 hypothetical protein CLG96_03345 [Sphingomonas oleivorans]
MAGRNDGRRGAGDQRKHGHNYPGLAPGRGHERHETPMRLDNAEPGRDQPDLTGDAAIPAGAKAVSSTADREQPSVLGGDVATRSGTAPTPDDEKSG